MWMCINFTVLSCVATFMLFLILTGSKLHKERMSPAQNLSSLPRTSNTAIFTEALQPPLLQQATLSSAHLPLSTSTQPASLTSPPLPTGSIMNPVSQQSVFNMRDVPVPHLPTGSSMNPISQQSVYNVRRNEASPLGLSPSPQFSPVPQVPGAAPNSPLLHAPPAHVPHGPVQITPTGDGYGVGMPDSTGMPSMIQQSHSAGFPSGAISQTGIPPYPPRPQPPPLYSVGPGARQPVFHMGVNHMPSPIPVSLQPSNVQKKTVIYPSHPASAVPVTIYSNPINYQRYDQHHHMLNTPPSATQSVPVLAPQFPTEQPMGPRRRY